ncbi:MAG: DUF1361 domain-containing protein [Scytolyngbya sp. HA4215-MV1]|jgi:uncharacterized membrane protein|nr:DUF1361 domain-containing protein [Scytolyngbya sp. HA4215-MV1]
MIAFLQDLLIRAIEIVWTNRYWMSWNLFLALIPLGLSVMLFRGKVARRSPTFAWWLGFLVFVAFLPNAPYILTDIIHLINDIRIEPSIWIITLVYFPLYTAFLFAGFEAYVVSLINLGYYLKRQGWGRSIGLAELTLHGLSAIGIYLGRFLRFNSWDFVTRLDTLATSLVEDVLGKAPLIIMLVTFAVVAALYWLMKRITLAVLTYQSIPCTKSLEA